MEHRIDLSTIPHRPGQSTDLEAKRERAWERLTEDEREYVLQAYAEPAADEWQMPFLEVEGASERVLYVLAATGFRLTAPEIAYLLIARWFRNMDPATVRAKLAALVRGGDARNARDGRTYATEQGIEKLRRIESAWLARDRVARGRAVRGEDPAGPAHRPSPPESRYEDRPRRAPRRYGERERYGPGLDGGDRRGGPRRDGSRDGERTGGARPGGDRRDERPYGPRRDDRRDARPYGPRRDDRRDVPRAPRRDGPGGERSYGPRPGDRRDSRPGSDRGPYPPQRRPASAPPRREGPPPAPRKKEDAEE
ncbi:MAG: hypothetical protein WD848_01740 [Dehalococcoidia bacterium]